MKSDREVILLYHTLAQKCGFILSPQTEVSFGQTDKGLILTPGTFTAEARREAVRDGVPPSELVNGEKLIEMFEHLELGLKPKMAYEVDEDFFEEYKD